jgi:xanthine dehydrogenase accessory factor
MSSSLHRLLPLFERERALHHPMVLATVVRTDGSTYTKPGAQLLLAGDGEYAGLLSGGCFEADLAEHARPVLAGGGTKLVSYDIRGSNDPIFGLGSGCEGAMDILLQRLDAPGNWQPMARLSAAWHAQRATALLLVVSSTHSAWPLGTAIFGDDGEIFGAHAGAASHTGSDRCSAATPLRTLATRVSHERSTHMVPQAVPGIDVLALVQPRPVHILLLGAGPDAEPVVALAAFLGWRVTVIDHRSRYAQAERFPGAAAVLDGGPAQLTHLLTTPTSRASMSLGPPAWEAAIIMSHHLTTDLGYLQAVAYSDIHYVELLGPRARSQRLLADLGADASRLTARLRAPIGLDLGAATPEAVALSIVSELHAAIAGLATAKPMSRKQA